jgi:prolipoprotein diacylglyceryl transferase
MYATLSDFLREIFGINLSLPIQMFGMMMGVSFLFAAVTLSIELKRKENLGLIMPVEMLFKKGYPVSPAELFSSALIGFLIGFKIIEAVFNYSDLIENPQEFILSLRGNWIAGIICAAIFAYIKYREREKEKLPEPKTITESIYPHQLVANITMYAAIGGLLGAKIFHNLENIDDFAKDPVDAIFSFSGLTFYGGLIVGAVAVLWYARKLKIPMLMMCDAAAPGLMLSYGTGRLGCHLSGDGDWGIANAAPKPASLNFLPDWMWSFSYPHNVLGEGVQIAGCVGKHCNQLNPPVFPTPFYEAIVCIGLFFLLWALRKNISQTGIMFFLYLLLNGIERFFIEKIRVNTKYHIYGHAITQAEIISTALIVTGIAGLYILRRRKTTSS